MFRNLLLGMTCFALSAIPSPHTAAEATSSQEPGLVAYYPLDEGSGSLARDRSGFFVLESSFSYPGEKIGANGFGRHWKDGEASWHPEVRADADGGLTISAQGA